MYNRQLNYLPGVNGTANGTAIGTGIGGGGGTKMLECLNYFIG
jgi:hypothetical protein